MYFMSNMRHTVHTRDRKEFATDITSESLVYYRHMIYYCYYYESYSLYCFHAIYIYCLYTIPCYI